MARVGTKRARHLPRNQLRSLADLVADPELTLQRGLATRAVRLLVHWALTDPEVARVEAFAEPWNVASQRVLERVGFTRKGLLRSYLCFPERRGDALIYSLLPDDLRSATRLTP